MRLSELRFSDLIRLKRHLSLQSPNGEEKAAKRRLQEGERKAAVRRRLHEEYVAFDCHVGRLYA